VAKVVPLDPAALQFARGEFARYYRAHPPPPPPRFSRREFAAFPFSAQSFMRRHASFRSAEEFHRFLADEAPRHVYYSSAYYRQPDHTAMSEKGWLGADLIFDLDADHLRHAEALDYPAQLALVKERFLQLLDEFLFGDFGIDPEQTTLVFSGGRGYHVHVRDPRYLELTSAERRELVEYILGVGVEPRSALRWERAGDSATLGLVGGIARTTERAARRLPSRQFQSLVDPQTPGWPGRISRSVLTLLARWDTEGEQTAGADLAAAGVGAADARRIARRLVKREKGREIRDHLTLEVFEGKDKTTFLDAVLERAAVAVQGETDAPVTTDIHRLIRLPGSLHGGTGLTVRTITREELPSFEPLRDAVPQNGSRATIRVVANVGVHYRLGEERIDAHAGEALDLSAPAALFLLLRGEGILTPAASPR
jgi:DNA primase small subunit